MPQHRNPFGQTRAVPSYKGNYYNTISNGTATETFVQFVGLFPEIYQCQSYLSELSEQKANAKRRADAAGLKRFVQATCPTMKNGFSAEWHLDALLDDAKTQGRAAARAKSIAKRWIAKRWKLTDKTVESYLSTVRAMLKGKVRNLDDVREVRRALRQMASELDGAAPRRPEEAVEQELSIPIKANQVSAPK